MLTSEAADGIADAFGLGRHAHLKGPVARGQLGRVWRLTTDRADVAVKEWFARPDPGEVARNAEFSERVRAAGVFTPRTLFTPTGGVTATVPNGRGSTDVRAFEWIDLQPRTRALDPVEIGRTLAALHLASEPTSDPVDNWFATGFGSNRWHEVLNRVAREGAPFADDLASLVDDLVAVEGVIEPHESTLVCHRDLWADNVLLAREGGVCVIDFENMGPADPSHELAMVIFEFGDDDPQRARLLHAAYRDAGGPGRVTRRGHFSMLVAEQAHIGQLACSRWVGSHDVAERERLASWFREIPDDPVTLARIDRVLTAVTGPGA